MTNAANVTGRARARAVWMMTAGVLSACALVAGAGMAHAQTPQVEPGFKVVAPPPFEAASPTYVPAAAKPRPVAAAATDKPGDIAGRYAILRGTKDTGCMLTLDERAKGPRSSNKAILAPACRDSGIVIFDPVGWEVVHGRLVLLARKGHDTHLDKQPEGTWLKDPKEGKSLALKRI